ncbi:hypothetical protein FQZ97_1230760 [compost metagenome]
MHGIAHGAAIAAGKRPALVLEAFDQEFRRTLDAFQGLLVGDEVVQGGPGFLQGLADMAEHAGSLPCQGRSWLE